MRAGAPGASFASATDRDPRLHPQPEPKLSFRPRPEHELTQLTDENLIAYLREAAAAGDAGAARSALGGLVYGYVHNVRGRVRLLIPTYAVEGVGQEVLARAIG